MNTFTNDEGNTVNRSRVADEWRVYYRIDDFDTLPARLREAARSRELERERQWGPRFRYEYRDAFSGLKPGDAIEVVYRYRRAGPVEILSIAERK